MDETDTMLFDISIFKITGLNYCKYKCKSQFDLNIIKIFFHHTRQNSFIEKQPATCSDQVRKWNFIKSSL